MNVRHYPDGLRCQVDRTDLGGQCPAYATLEVLVGCRHEHVVTSHVCDRCLTIARDLSLFCTSCADVGCLACKVTVIDPRPLART